MANEISKTMAALAVGGMLAGLAACGGGQANPETPEGGGEAAAPADGAKEGATCSGAKEGATCSGEKKEGASCASNGKCGGEKKEAPAEGGAAQ